jgi:lysophospholipase
VEVEREAGRTAGRAEPLLTHDDERYADELWWRTERPELAMGPGSWGWTRGGLRVEHAAGSAGDARRDRYPGLLACRERDRLVSFAAIAAPPQRIPAQRFRRLRPGRRHELLREADPVRDRALAAIDEFLDGVRAS